MAVSVYPLNDRGFKARLSSVSGLLLLLYCLVIKDRLVFAQEPEQMTVEVGSDVTVPCNASLQPRPILQWTAPNSVVLTVSSTSDNLAVDEGGTLTISSVTAQDQGTYTCFANISLGPVLALVQLTVEGPPEFTSRPTSRVVLEGERTTFSCHAAGSPTPEVTWYRGEQDRQLQQDERTFVSLDGDLTLTTVLVEDDGVYKCVANSSRGSVQAFAVLTVHVPPSFTTAPSSRSVMLGDTVELMCRVYGVPVPTQRWVRAGHSLVLEDNMAVNTNHTLTITSIRQNQLGQYTCLAHNQAGQRAASATLHLSGQPVFTTQPVNTTVNVSDPLTLSCRAQQSSDVNPVTPSINWYRGLQHDGADILIESIDSPSGGGGGGGGGGRRFWATWGGDLVFATTRQEDEGWYYCNAMTPEVVVYADPIFINVQVPPVIQAISNPPPTPNDGQVNITCLVQGDPNPEVTWRSPEGLEVRDGVAGYGLDSGTLTIERATNQKDGGLWTCVACNTLGCDSVDTLLAVEGKPVIRRVEARHNTTTIAITCLAVGLPPPAVTYISEGSSVNGSRGHHVMGDHVTIERDWLREEYECSATNVYGEESLILSVPEAPELKGATPSSRTVTLSLNVTSRLGALPLEGVVVERRRTEEYQWTSSYIPATDLYLHRPAERKRRAISYIPLVDVYPNANRKERGYSDIAWEDLHPFIPTGRNMLDNTQFPWINLHRQSLEVWKRRDLGSTHFLHHWHARRKRRESSDTPTETDTPDGGPTATPPIRQDSQELSEVVGVNSDGDVVVTVAGLVPYSVYMMRVRLVNVLGQGPVSGNSVRVFTLPDAPPPPADVTLTSENKDIFVTWTVPAHLHGERDDISFQIRVKNASEVTVANASVPASQPAEVVVSDLDLGNHTVTVAAVNSRLQMSSEEVTVSVLVTQPVPMFVPRIVNVTAVDDSAIIIVWTTPEDPEASQPEVEGYFVRVEAVSLGSPLLSRISDPEVDSVTVSGLEERSRYNCSVAAFNGGGTGAFSSPVAVITYYGLFSDLAYKEEIELAMTGRWIAVIGGCVGGIVFVVIVVCLACRWRTLRHGNSLDLMRPSHGLDPLYLENPKGLYSTARRGTVSWLRGMDMYRLFENTNTYAGTATSSINNSNSNTTTISIGRGLSRDVADGMCAVGGRGGGRVEGDGREQDGGRAWWMRFRPSRILSSTAALRSIWRRLPPRKTSATTPVISHPHFSGQGALVLPPAFSSSSSSTTLTTAAATSSPATVNQASPSSKRSHGRLAFGDTFGGEEVVDDLPDGISLSTLSDGVTVASLDVKESKEKTGMSGHGSIGGIVNRNTTREGERGVVGTPSELTLSVLYDGVTSAMDLPCDRISERDSPESVINRNTACGGGSAVNRNTTRKGERSVDGTPSELTLSILYDGVTSAVDRPCERTSGRNSAESVVNRNTACDSDSAVDHLANSVSMSALPDGVSLAMDVSMETPSTGRRDRTEREVDRSTACGGASTLDSSQVDAKQGQHNVSTSSRPLRVDIERELVERPRKKIGDNPKLTPDDTGMPVSVGGAFTQSPQQPENKYGARSAGGQRLTELLATAEREPVEITGHHPKRMLHDSSIPVSGGEGSTALRSTEFPEERGHDSEIEAAGKEGGSETPTNDGQMACVSFLDAGEQSLQYSAVVFRNHTSVAGRDYGHLYVPDSFELDPDDEHSHEERSDDDEESPGHRCLEQDSEGIRRRGFDVKCSRHQKFDDEDKYLRQQRMTDDDEYLRKQTLDYDEYTDHHRVNEDTQHPHPVRGCPSVRKADQENVYHILHLLDRDLDDYLPLETPENSTEIDSLNNSTSFPTQTCDNSVGSDTTEGLPYLPTETLQKPVRVDSIDWFPHLPTRTLETIGADSPYRFPSKTHNDLEAKRATSLYLLTKENDDRHNLLYCLPPETDKNVSTCGPSASFRLPTESSDTRAEVSRLTGSISHPHFLSERSPLSKAVFQPNGETHTFGLNPLYSSEDDQTSTEDQNSKFNSETDSYEINPLHSIFNPSLDPPSHHAEGMTRDTKSSSSELVDQGSSHRAIPPRGVSLPRSTHVKEDDRQLLEELIGALDSLGQNGSAANNFRKKFFTVQRRKAGPQPEVGQRVTDMSTPKFYTLQRKRDTSRAWKAIGKLTGSLRSKVGSKNDTLIGSLKSTFGRKSNKVIGPVRSRGTIDADRRFSMEMALPTGLTKLTLSGGRKPLTVIHPTEERGSGRRHSCRKSSSHLHHEQSSSTSSAFSERSSTGEGSGRSDSCVVALEDDAWSGGNSSLTEGMDGKEEALFGTSPVLLDMANLY